MDGKNEDLFFLFKWSRPVLYSVLAHAGYFLKKKVSISAAQL
jgi:hypothetical protein